MKIDDQCTYWWLKCSILPYVCMAHEWRCSKSHPFIFCIHTRNRSHSVPWIKPLFDYQPFICASSTQTGCAICQFITHTHTHSSLMWAGQHRVFTPTFTDMLFNAIAPLQPRSCTVLHRTTSTHKHSHMLPALSVHLRILLILSDIIRVSLWTRTLKSLWSYDGSCCVFFTINVQGILQKNVVERSLAWDSNHQNCLFFCVFEAISVFLRADLSSAVKNPLTGEIIIRCILSQGSLVHSQTPR